VVEQAGLFAPENPIDTKIAEAEQRGQRITPWVRHAMHSWAERGVKPPIGAQVTDWHKTRASGHNPHGLTWLELGQLPSPCNCLECKQPAVIFPPEEGAINGYCICPCCSFPSMSGCTHKERRAEGADA
jgi:hypothetical protein